MDIFGENSMGIVNIGEMNVPAFFHNRIELFEQKRDLQNGGFITGDGKMIAPGLNLDLFKLFEEL